MNLLNEYYGLRHAESKANAQGIIISSPQSGIPDYGLTDKGKQQIESNLGKYRATLTSPAATICLTSDFSRARETAERFCSALNLPAPVIERRFRERSFGTFEGTSNENYTRVWMEDQKDIHHTAFGVESLSQLANRMQEAIEDLEESYCGHRIIIAGHGDPLVVLQCILTGRSPGEHRDLKPFANAELRLFQ